MTIFIKTHLLNKTITIKDIIINYSTNIDNYDYEIITNLNVIDETYLIELTLRNIFANPDKRYKVIFKDIEFIPYNYIENDYFGIINFNNKTIDKYCSYKLKNVSFCLYNKKPMYLEGAKENLLQYKTYDTSLNCIFYIRNDVPEDCINNLINNGAEIVNCCNMPDWYMMFARFLPSENENNKFYISRDTDCRLLNREKIALQQWLNTDKSLHIIRDHPYHGVKILGGMWGLQNKNIPNIRFLISEWCCDHIYDRIGKLSLTSKGKGHDQIFLNIVYSLMNTDIYVNDEFFNFEKNRFKIDHIRTNNEYIGKAFII
jgi:hypothetical protein